MTARSGSSAEFEALYEAHGPMAFAIAMSILEDPQLAEDAAQETWVRVSRALGQGIRLDRPGGWIATIARHEAWRIGSRTPPAIRRAEPSVPRPEAEAAEKELMVLMEEALGDLDEEDRWLLTLRYLQGLPPREIRKRLGLSKSGVWKKLNSAIHRLRHAMERKRRDS